MDIFHEFAILDPFCGSGTTLLAAKQNDYDSIGIDLNPIACLISRVKTSPIDEKFENTYTSIIDKAKYMYHNENLDIPEIPNLDHWFKKGIQKAISSIIIEINKIDDSNMKDNLNLALSSIIVRVSNQESDTRYAAIDKNSSPNDVFEYFRSACSKLYDIKSEFVDEKNVDVINKDILKVSENDISRKIGLVITSPPYPNAYEYWLYHKYRMWWLGYNPIDVRESEIGCRPHYQKKNGETEADFTRQMESVFELIIKCLVDGGHICFVIGRSIIKGRVIDNAQIIKAIGEKFNLTLVAEIEREISATKKSFNLKYGKIKTETIIILRKDAHGN